MIQSSVKFCSTCGSRATPRALYCVDCGSRLAPTARTARTPRPAGLRVGGRYALRRLIDMGGNGAVYEAEHLLLGTTHALKETLAADPESVAQFLAEARLLAQLDHPVLVRVTDYFIEPSGAVFLVMDYVAGETLQRKLEQPNPGYSIADVVGWLLQLCAALEYLHSYRDPASGRPSPIIHRDIKPLNIVLAPDGRVKLLDMGIARVALPGQATGRVARAVTEPFAPIEQYGAGTDQRSDLYALGVTAYVLLTRQLPPSALERVAQPAELKIRAINRAVPAPIASAIEKAMQPQAEARFASVEAFRRALELGWVAGERIEHAAAHATPSGRLARESGLLGAIRRALGGAPAPSEPGAPPAPATGGLTLSERLVEWRSAGDTRGAIEVILALERTGDAPPQLRLSISISERGQRGKMTFQQIVLPEPEARAFAARLADLPRLGLRITADFGVEVGRTRLHAHWPGARGPLMLGLHATGPRGGVKSCGLALDRRQAEALSFELQRALRRIRPA
ncbi:protein kinase domain-containing protein [Kouleothrix sp.]|uniref:protein kinase domain-containing protein n=1 Tax=Kouleothrix sp. TaxID=2779161 RepID=UPI00391D992F